jgi:hypothetical protein
MNAQKESKDVALLFLLPRRYMEWSFQGHFPAILFRGKDRYPLNRKLTGPLSGLFFLKKKIALLL